MFIQPPARVGAFVHKIKKFRLFSKPAGAKMPARLHHSGGVNIWKCAKAKQGGARGEREIRRLADFDGVKKLVA